MATPHADHLNGIKTWRTDPIEQANKHLEKSAPTSPTSPQSTGEWQPTSASKGRLPAQPPLAWTSSPPACWTALRK